MGFSVGLTEKAKFFSFGILIFLVLVHYPQVNLWSYSWSIISYIITQNQWQLFQFTEQLIYFTNKHTYPGDHCNGNYNIFRKKFGHMDVNGPNQAKNEFLIFLCLLTCWHLPWRSQLPVLQKGLGLHYL